jgi:RNA polymerase sigma-70 factor (ECF subfamily)
MGPKGASGTGTTLLVLLRDPTNPDAWEAFVQRYAPKVLRWCLGWCGERADAEDVTQELLYRLARQIRCFPYDSAKGGFRAWLRELTRQTWADVRDRRHAGGPAPEGWEEPRPPLEEVLDQEFLFELYEEAKARVRARVSSATWRAFELLALHGWPGPRVAAEVNLSISSVYVAKCRVKALLEEEVRRLEEPDQENKES